MSVLKQTTPPSTLTSFVLEHRDDAKEFQIQVIKNRYNLSLTYNVTIGLHKITYERQITNRDIQRQIKKYLHSKLGGMADCFRFEWKTITLTQPISIAKVVRRMAKWKDQHPNKKLPDNVENKILNEKQTIHTWSCQTEWKLKR